MEGNRNLHRHHRTPLGARHAVFRVKNESPSLGEWLGRSKNPGLRQSVGPESVGFWITAWISYSTRRASDFEEVLKGIRWQHDRVTPPADVFGNLHEPPALVFLEVNEEHSFRSIVTFSEAIGSEGILGPAFSCMFFFVCFSGLEKPAPRYVGCERQMGSRESGKLEPLVRKWYLRTAGAHNSVSLPIG